MPGYPRLNLEREQKLLAPVEQVWELLSNTNRLNRAVGLPRVSYGAFTNQDSPVYCEAAARNWLGIFACWREFPFEWILHQRISIFREFEGRVLRTLRVNIRLSPIPSGTRVSMSVEVEVRRRWILPLLHWMVSRFLSRSLRYIAAALPTRTDQLAVPHGTFNARVADAKLAQRLSRYASLAETGHSAATYLRQHLCEADDTDIQAMQPFALADRWGMDRDETLTVFLHATREGVLEMNWQLLCPNCRVPKAQFRSLREMSPRIHCEFCNIDFEAELDQYIELRFDVNPALRSTKDGIYCIGSPSRYPHIVAQVTLPDGADRELTLDLPSEPIRLRTLKSNFTLNLDPKQRTEQLRLELGVEGWNANGRVFQPGATTLRMNNRSGQAVTVALEKMAWHTQAVTAAYVTALQQFRSLFALEVLPLDKQVGIRNLTLLFTDLKDSTFLYENIGDAPAFGRVQKHFDYLSQQIAAHRGAIVKTMGDAVMAVFVEPADALSAALVIQRKLSDFCRLAGIEPRLVLKLGLHCGPAISMNAGGILDYFGRTVNLAARIQSQSAGGDIILSDEMVSHASVQALLEQLPSEPQVFQCQLKGFDGRHRLYRIVIRGLQLHRKAA